MSPEQVRGQSADARSDLFALGAVMFEMLTGKGAFAAAAPGAVIDAVLNRKPTSPSQIIPEVPQELSGFVLKALEKDPALRYQSARELLVDLRRLARDTDRGASPRTDGGLAAFSTRSRVRAIGAIGLAVVLLAGSWWLTNHFRSGTPSAEERPTLTPADQARLVVLPFENLTRRFEDDWLAGAFADSVSAGLQPIETLILVPRERVVEIYSAESRRESEPLTTELARQLSRTLRVRYYVHGSYQRVGDDLRVVARLVDLTAGEIQAQDTLTGAFADVLKIEESLASRLAARLAPTAAAHLAQKPATDNLAAHQLVTDARALYALGRFAEARSALLRATELDSTVRPRVGAAGKVERAAGVTGHGRGHSDFRGARQRASRSYHRRYFESRSC